MQYYLANSGIQPLPPTAFVDTNSGRNNSNDRQQPRPRQALSDGPEGTLKTKKFYKSENACHLCRYDVLKQLHSGNC